jgi:aspartate-semialdehyde dehydrogenase
MPDQQIVLIGSESLLGRELRDAFSGSRLDSRLKLVGAESEGSVIAHGEDEPVLITPLETEHLQDTSIAILAGSPAAAGKAFGLLSALDPVPAIIDLTFALEERPQARLRAPLVEDEGDETPTGAVHVIAQPAAIALAFLLRRLHAAFPMRRSVVQVFEPASERGRQGLEELQKQTVNLLSFHKLPTDVFDAQLAFNLLPRFGTQAKPPLEQYEHRIERHLATLLAKCGARTPMPSLRLVQAPVFHGYSLSIWVEFESAADPHAIREALACAQIEVRGPQDEPPTNVGVAGEGGLTVSVERDDNDARACWIWGVVDNLRIAAENAIMAAAGILERR